MRSRDDPQRRPASALLFFDDLYRQGEGDRSNRFKWYLGMLDQIVFGIQVLGTVVEFLLLGRILLLRFQRVYHFLTLYAAVNVLVDTSVLLAGVESAASFRIFFYSRFLFALIYPLVAWDVFEEAKARVGKIRRVHLPRMVSGLLITVLIGAVASMGIEDQDFKGTSATTDFVGLFLWLGSASTSLLFIWNVTRTSRQIELPLPGNTRVWATFFLITFARAVIDCGIDAAGGLIPHAPFQIISGVLVLFDVGLASWCLFKLKPLSTDPASATENASL